MIRPRGWRVYAHSVRLFCVVAAAIVLVASGAWSSSRVTAAPDQSGCMVELLFNAIHHIHVHYDAGDCELPPGQNYHRITRVRLAAGDWELMGLTESLSDTIQVGVPEDIYGTDRVIELQLIAEVEQLTYFGPVYVEVLMTTGSYRTHLLHGTLTEDESIPLPAAGAPLYVQQVLVPPGRTLSLAPGRYIQTVNAVNLEVRGQLIVGDGVTFDAVVALYTPHEFAKLKQWQTLIFRPGSAGSTVSGSGGDNVFRIETQAGAPVYFADLQDDTVQVVDGGAQVVQSRNVIVDGLAGTHSVGLDRINGLAVRMAEGQQFNGGLTIRDSTQVVCLCHNATFGSGAQVTLFDLPDLRGQFELVQGAHLVMDRVTGRADDKPAFFLAGAPAPDATVRDSKNLGDFTVGGGPALAFERTDGIAISLTEGQVYSGTLTITGGDGVRFGSGVSNAFDMVLGKGADVRLEGVTGFAGRLEVRNGAQFRFINGMASALELYLTGSPPGQATVLNSKLRGDASVIGGAAEFTNNQFAGDLNLFGKSGVQVNNNALLGAVNFYDYDLFGRVQGLPSWSSASGPAPVIAGNSFYGPRALDTPHAITRDIAIGANFYGDPAGPRQLYRDGTPSPVRFLGPRGATVQLNSSAAGGPRGFVLASGTLPNPPPWTDRDVPPRIWVHASRIGQNTLDDHVGDLTRGKEILVTLDVVASQPLANVRARYQFAALNRYAAPVTLYRTLAQAPAQQVHEGRTTINVILPAMEDIPSGGIPLSVFLDQGSYSGAPAIETPLLNQLIQYTPGAMARPYRVALIPVHLFGFCSGRSDVSAVRAELMGRLPDLFRVRPQDVEVTVLPAWNQYCSLESALFTTFLVNNTVANLVANDQLGRVVAILPKGGDFDHVIGVMPMGKLGDGVDGANAPIARRYILVDAGKPDAVIHEIGHAIGLYRGSEQYALHPPDGIAPAGVTAFATNNWTPLPVSNARVLHFPHPDDHWQLNHGYSDIMGAANLNWPITATLGSFNAYFGGLQQTQAAVAPASPEQVGWVYLGGMLRADPQRPGAYLLDPATIRIMDVTNHMADESDDPYAGQPVTRYTLRYLNAQGEVVSYNVFGVYAHANHGLALDGYTGWRPLYGVRAEAVRLELRRDDTGEVVYARRRAASLDTPILEPAPGAVLGDTLTIRWAADSQPLTRYISFSSDNGATWQAGVWVEGDSITLATDFLPADAPIILRAWTSDGFFNAEQRVLDLTVRNRAPSVTIRSPVAGMTARPGTEWSLAARAYDIEDGLLQAVTWRSSRDGILDPAASPAGVILSPGAHTLTAEVNDRHGATARATVQVTVGPVTQADLRLEPDALVLQGGSRDPVVGLPVILTAGVTYTVFVRVAGAGAPVTATLALSMTPPGGTSNLLGRASLPMGVFGYGSLRADFVPAVTGVYRLDAAIESATLPDPNRENNHRSWVFGDVAAPSSHVTHLPVLQR